MNDGIKVSAVDLIGSVNTPQSTGICYRKRQTMITPVSYYGGKQRMVKKIVPLIPEHYQYVEPFFGGGAIFWAKEPSPVEAINDTNKACITFWRVLQTRFDELSILLRCTLHSEWQYRHARDIIDSPGRHSDVELAWAFWVQTNMSFGKKIKGGFSFSNKDRRSQTIHNKINMLTDEYEKRLISTQIFCRDAIDLIKLKDKENVFFYLDPPYAEADGGHYDKDKEVYFRLLDYLPNILGKFLLSSYPSERLAQIRGDLGLWSIDYDMPLGSSKELNKTCNRKIECLTWNYDVEPVGKALFNVPESRCEAIV